MGTLWIDSSLLIALGNERPQVLSPKTNLTKVINDHNCIIIISPVAIFTFTCEVSRLVETASSQQRLMELMLMMLLPNVYSKNAFKASYIPFHNCHT